MAGDQLGPFSKDHEHDFHGVGVLALGQINALTAVPTSRPAVVMVCSCGETATTWVRDPVEPAPIREPKPPRTFPSERLDPSRDTTGR